MLWFKEKKIRSAVAAAQAEQLAHEAVHPEPYDAGQRREAILIRSRWMLIQAGVKPPASLESYV